MAYKSKVGNNKKNNYFFRMHIYMYVYCIKTKKGASGYHCGIPIPKSEYTFRRVAHQRNLQSRKGKYIRYCSALYYLVLNVFLYSCIM